MKRHAALAAFLLLSACSSETAEPIAPTKDAEVSAQLEQDAKSIEQAADEAAQLIEEDANANEAAP